MCVLSEIWGRVPLLSIEDCEVPIIHFTPRALLPLHGARMFALRKGLKASKYVVRLVAVL